MADDSGLSAREHFSKGTQYFDLGRYDDAIKEYEAAYELKDQPVLLYNIAQAHFLAKRYKEALQFYKVYLRRDPKAPNRLVVEAKIAEVVELLEHELRTGTPGGDGRS